MTRQQIKHTFYCPAGCFAPGDESGALPAGVRVPEGMRVVFPREEAHHALHVLRVGAGDLVRVTDGEGGLFHVEMEAVSRKQAVGRVLEVLKSATEPHVRLRVGLGLLKQTARYETFLEKAVELGVHSIVPLESERTERSRLRLDRCRKILVAALKQSGRSRLPALEAPATFSSVVEGLAPGDTGFVAHEAGSPQDHLRLACHALQNPDSAPAEGQKITPGHVITLLVGPEGGFSDEEMRQAADAGWTTVWLGPRRLRAETAAMAAAGFIIMSLE